MLQNYLIDALILCGILLLIALTVGAVQLIIILLDFRRMANEIKEKIKVLTSFLDIVSLFMGGLEGAKKRIGKKLVPGGSTLLAFSAGLKKALQVFLKK